MQTCFSVDSGEGCATRTAALGRQLCSAKHESSDGHLLVPVSQHYLGSNLHQHRPTIFSILICLS